MLTQLARHGLAVRPDYSYARVLDGFSASLDARSPSRCSSTTRKSPASTRCGSPSRRRSRRRRSRPGCARSLGVGRARASTARGVTVALLDTGVDRSQPYLGGQGRAGRSTSSAGPATAAPRRDPQNRALIERHGTELAGVLVGSGGPDGIHGVAPAATVLPIRVAGWQPAGNGRDAIYARSDQVIAGLERAVDPNGDGDTHDAVRVALLGVAEPFAAFADSPEAQAIEGARALDVLVVTPAGNDGRAPARCSARSQARPARRPRSSVGATDSRPAIAVVRVVFSQGLAVLVDGELPLLDSVPPVGALDLGRAPAAERRLTARPRSSQPAAIPSVSGAAAVRRAPAVLLYGAQPPTGSLGDLGCPVVGSRRVARAASSTLGGGSPVAGRVRPHDDAARTRGRPGHVVLLPRAHLRRALAPQLLAPGVDIPTSDPGSAGDGEPAFATVTGTSVAAAAVAGAAALLVQARPGLTADDAREPPRRLGARGPRRCRRERDGRDRGLADHARLRGLAGLRRFAQPERCLRRSCEPTNYRWKQGF